LITIPEMTMPKLHQTLRIGITLAVTTAIIGILTTLPSQAGRKNFAGDDYVVAESRFGNGTVVGPVRATRVGLQVRTPGGNWLDCSRSCAETLRVNTVDFWQNEQGVGPGGAIDQPDGLLSRWLHWSRRY
jgi:hypothetical protein